ncbi:MAG: 4-hydroxy-3-methylbut-2-enyl diphosphate reductase [Dysgonamonadaceae bacterium]|jgi:4-hydroxy-3-methylbut-2-enyl diphosphate reductase|nr:4-hydroxy-3-methylbut-2-enyl diphosphate reductase [Dysgonamonadaceae bacterium]
MLRVEIDQDSGFCFGVVNAIKNAEEELLRDEQLACLGDIVHNNQEVERLQKKGLKTINHEQLKLLKGKKVLLRAHGEPPSTYKTARENNIRIIDATCPVVLQLQKKIKKQYETSGVENAQIVIFGKIGHAEVNGLVGQTDGNAVVIEKKEDIDHLDFNREIYLFSQTTMSLNDFRDIVKAIKNRMKPDVVFKYFDTICRQVANRMTNIKIFAARHHLVLFVAGKKSSNGKVLYEECLQANPNTHLISTPNEIDPEWLKGISSVGICGATSTPKWLMEDVATRLTQYPISSKTSEG